MWDENTKGRRSRSWKDPQVTTTAQGYCWDYRSFSLRKPSLLFPREGNTSWSHNMQVKQQSTEKQFSQLPPSLNKPTAADVLVGGFPRPPLHGRPKISGYVGVPWGSVHSRVPTAHPGRLGLDTFGKEPRNSSFTMLPGESNSACSHTSLWGVLTDAHTGLFIIGVGGLII